MTAVRDAKQCGSGGAAPSGGLGAKLPTLLLCLGLVAAAPPSFTTLHQFTGLADGGNPTAIVGDATGALYGSTISGGARSCLNGGVKEFCGGLYKIDPMGRFSTVLSFDKKNGWQPGALIRDGQKLYGVTARGGAGNLGVVYSVRTDGTHDTVLHAFTGSDGSDPTALVLGPQGVIYGVTASGGVAGQGVLYQLNPDGSYADLHDFAGSRGYLPNAILLGPSGVLYGSTSSTAMTGFGGTVFSYDPAAARFQLIHVFDTPNSATSLGYSPILGAIDAGGDLFGATSRGGLAGTQADGNGTLFELAASVTGFSFQPLYQFTGGSDGQTPESAPALQGGHTLIGTTAAGMHNGGALYSFDLGAAAMTVLHQFDPGHDDPADGSFPSSTPFVAHTGRISGTTYYGGLACRCGTSFGYGP